MIIDTAKRQLGNTDKNTFRKYTNRMYEEDIQYILDLIQRGDTVYIPLLNEKNSNYLAKCLGLNEEETHKYLEFL